MEYPCRNCAAAFRFVAGAAGATLRQFPATPGRRAVAAQAHSGRARRLLYRYRIGGRKGVHEGIVERLFQAPSALALVMIGIVSMAFTLRIRNHVWFLRMRHPCAAHAIRSSSDDRQPDEAVSDRSPRTRCRAIR
jgi:hypothetical protein